MNDKNEWGAWKKPSLHYFINANWVSPIKSIAIPINCKKCMHCDGFGCDIYGSIKLYAQWFCFTDDYKKYVKVDE